jgi:hypothetical protein
MLYHSSVFVKKCGLTLGKFRRYQKWQNFGDAHAPLLKIIIHDDFQLGVFTSQKLHLKHWLQRHPCRLKQNS